VQIGERLRITVANSAVRTEPQPVPLSISLGIAQAQSADTPALLLQRADASLYQSKAAGRNRLTVVS
jgi:PleD family two-component response regulator